MNDLNRMGVARPARTPWQRPSVSTIALREARNAPTPINADASGTFGS
ncbi:hypothetical protein SAMN06297144_2832 [Sphingomonas guangdongensis]|uniref:Uncharacterized protein n=1 Tax=Sphingomonas guangdongensis TaxID=1141890 RepID=A0A285R0R0_9SPHN|nr:hypothetical protein [Sphingomonas guangdongensis]SOB87696.1 hypothetical protein SAMN06297144_2832 [Sphingomonas guangdongensis]